MLLGKSCASARISRAMLLGKSCASVRSRISFCIEQNIKKLDEMRLQCALRRFFDLHCGTEKEISSLLGKINCAAGQLSRPCERMVKKEWSKGGFGSHRRKTDMCPWDM